MAGIILDGVGGVKIGLGTIVACGLTGSGARTGCTDGNETGTDGDESVDGVITGMGTGSRMRLIAIEVFPASTWKRAERINHAVPNVKKPIWSKTERLQQVSHRSRSLATIINFCDWFE